MQMKKRIAFCVALLLLVTALSGCASASAEAAEARRQATAAQAPETTVATLSEGILNILEETASEGQTATGDGTQTAVTVPYSYDELTVATTNPLSGRFFTGLWGGNTSDLDVRALIHGYSLTEYKTAEGTYGIDDSVVNAFATQNPGGNRTYTISIYEDLYYSDGTQITAKDYIFAILLNLAPQIAEIGGETTGMDYIVGAENYRLGKSTVLTGVRLLGDFTFSITVSKNYLPFFYELGYLNINPYPISVIAPGCEIADDGEGVYIKNDTKFTAKVLQKTILNAKTGYQSHPSVVSGPYKLISYDGDRAVFEINPYYKGNSSGNKPRIQKIIYQVTDNDSAIEGLKNAEIGLVNKTLNADTVTDGISLVAEQPYSMTAYPRSGYSFISFNCERATVSDAAVRQAIAMCFDKEGFTAEYTGNYGLAVDGYFGIGQWMYQLVNGTLSTDAVTPEEQATLSLDGLKTYALDTEAAAKLLQKNGWKLASDTDEVRSKTVKKETVTLDLTLYCPAETGIKPLLEKYLGENLQKVGIRLTIVEKDFDELLSMYYRQTERDCDMMYLATNFDAVFDPSETFNPDDAYQGVSNRTGIADTKLYQLAQKMSKTEPGDVLSYVKKWIAFEERYTEVLPTIPVYSNIYYDFYTSALHDYEITANITWTQAIVNATLSDVTETAVMEETLDDGTETVIFD